MSVTPQVHRSLSKPAKTDAGWPPHAWVSSLRVIVLAVLLAPAAFADDLGSVEQIGLGGTFRPNTWVALRARVKLPHVGEYRLVVVQDDLDRDRVAYSRRIAGGPGAASEFWCYFQPQPHGWSMGTSAGPVAVFVETADGKRLGQLRMEARSRPLSDSGPGPAHSRLVGVVIAGETSPPMDAYSAQLRGMLEPVQMVRLTPRELPDHVLGYSGLDHLVWSGDASKLAGPQARAIEEYVRLGGNLVVLCGPPGDAPAWAHLLPVAPGRPQGLLPPSSQPMHAMRQWAGLPRTGPKPSAAGPWADPRQRVMTVRATPATRARVLAWTSDEPSVPLLATNRVGNGCVRWLAFDLASPELGRPGIPAFAWARVWDRILGASNASVPSKQAELTDLGGAEPALPTLTDAVVLSQGLLGGIAMPGTGMALAFFVLLCFAGYAILAGPILFIVLGRLRRRTLSWFIFAAGGILLSLATLLVVYLFRSGNPAISHALVVRWSPEGDAVADDWVGLYLPRTGTPLLSLRLPGNPGTTHGASITPLGRSIEQAADARGFPARRDYGISIAEPGDGTMPGVQVPLRGTLKKLKARAVWKSPSPPIEGQVAIAGPMLLSGQLVNRSGHPYYRTYLAWMSPTQAVVAQVASQPFSAGATMDLQKIIAAADEPIAARGENNAVGYLRRDWCERAWYPRASGLQGRLEDSLVMLSLYSKLLPADGTGTPTRPDARELDISGLLDAGYLVVLGFYAAPGSLIDVDGAQVNAAGFGLDQVCVPLFSPQSNP